MTGKSRETINTATKEGTLSFSLNSKRHKVIEIAELERVYPLVKTMEEIKSSSGPVKASPVASKSDTGQELAVLRQQLAGSEALREALTTERERERRQLESEIENLRTSLEKSQDQHNKALLLITDQSQKGRGGDWEATVRNLQEKIVNQETNLEKRILALRVEAKRETLAEIKNQPWWQLVWK